MGGYENDRKWVIEKKNDVAIKSMDLKEKIEKFDEKRADVEEGIARIPTDLPPELQQQVDIAIENARAELQGKGDELRSEAREVEDIADEAMDMADNIRMDLAHKADKFRGLGGIPLIGSFADAKASELDTHADEMVDLRQETQKYQDELIYERNRLFENR